MGSVTIPYAGHPAELSEHLREKLGDVSITGSMDGSMLTVEVEGVDATAISAAIADFTPTADPAHGYRGNLPTVLRDHVPHLRDFRAAVGAGTQITNAQRDHVISDIILALRVLVDDRVD